ncbi:MAG TPA: hypothetical protein ENK50_02615 [Sedimenticola sp.]|nr:hypothetical protein [Sedimenticola sp.]
MFDVSFAVDAAVTGSTAAPSLGAGGSTALGSAPLPLEDAAPLAGAAVELPASAGCGAAAATGAFLAALFFLADFFLVAFFLATFFFAAFFPARLFFTGASVAFSCPAGWVFCSSFSAITKLLHHIRSHVNKIKPRFCNRI